MTQPASSREPLTRLTPSRSQWLLRTTGVIGFVAALTGVLIAPGLRGLARDHVVDMSNHLAWTLAYFFSGLLVAIIGIAAYQLSSTVRFQNAWKAMGVSAAGLASALAAPALFKPLPALEAVALAVVTSFVVLTAATSALRASHTRAIALLMAFLAVAGLLRVVAWDVARVAGDSGNASLYAKARGLATAAVVFEVLGQMVAAAWLGTRSRLGGQALSSFAVGVAWILTYGAAQGASATAKPWAVAAHFALATASSLPQPYGPNSLTVFLLASSILLAGVAAVQGKQVIGVVLALSLSLIGRGTFDVPIHALAACAAALWLTVAVTDERAVWHSLVASRGPRATRPPRPAGVDSSPGPGRSLGRGAP
jgi:hypothetical protein